jgi:DNA-binding LacI/PurR family transcriptional regulator
MPVSIKDIAKVANVSFSTVSRALANSPRVRPETRRRIQQLAIEMGYTPSAAARSLVTHRTKTIGVVATTMTDTFQAEVVQSIEEIAIQHDYSVILTQSGFASERELVEIQALRERRVDGIILISVRAGGVYASVLQGTGIPLVFINSRQTDYGHSVRVDSLAGSRTAVCHLLELGHRRIAYIAGPDQDWDNLARQAGYQQALATCRLSIDPALIVQGNSRPEGGIRAMQQLLALRHPPTAVFCYNDVTALGAMTFIWRLFLNRRSRQLHNPSSSWLRELCRPS